MPRRSPKAWKYIVFPVLLVFALMIIAVYLFLPRPSKTDCSFIGWKQSIGVELGTFVKDVSAAKGKLDISESQIRELDTLLTDYGAKYETACKDLQAGRINSAEYSCRTQSTAKVLSNIRSLQVALQSLSQVNDPATQKQIATTALENFHELARAEDQSNCSASMSVNPTKVTFEKEFPERSVRISNSGNNDFTFAIEQMPEAFLAVPTSGIVAKGGSVVVAIYRIAITVPTIAPIGFDIKDNWNNRVHVDISFTSQNAALYRTLSARILGAAAQQHRPPDLTDALQVVETLTWEDSIAGDQLQASRYLVAANVLLEAGSHEPAKSAFDRSIDILPAIARAPASGILRGVMAERVGDTRNALLHCVSSRAWDTSDDRARASSDMCEGAMLLAVGNTTAAKETLRTQSVAMLAMDNPNLTSWLGSTVQVPLQEYVGVPKAEGKWLIPTSRSEITLICLFVGVLVTVAALSYLGGFIKQYQLAHQQLGAAVGSSGSTTDIVLARSGQPRLLPNWMQTGQLLVGLLGLLIVVWPARIGLSLLISHPAHIPPKPDSRLLFLHVTQAIVVLAILIIHGRQLRALRYNLRGRGQIAKETFYQFRVCWLLMWSMWLVLYTWLAIRVVLGPSNWLDWMNDVFNIISGFAIWMCFLVLDQPSVEVKGSSNRRKPFVIAVAVVCSIGLCCIFLALADRFVDIGHVGLVSVGLYNGLALACLTGRLGSHYIGTPRWMLLFLYLYSMLQVLYSFFDSIPPQWTWGVFVSVLVLKVMLWFAGADMFAFGGLDNYLKAAEVDFRVAGD
jgi:hypothetical protein